MNSYYDLPVIHLLRKAPQGVARSPYAVESNPWSRRGEIEAALLFRGTIVSAYGFVETRLAELTIQASRLECYTNLAPTLPYITHRRLKFLRQVFASGPLEPYQEVAEQFFKRFEKIADTRHLVAHARMQVLPDWGVTFEDYRIVKGEIINRTKRFPMEEFEVLASNSARFSRLSQRLSNDLAALNILPPL